MSDNEEPQVNAQGDLMSEDNIARRIKYEMEQRGWSQERMSKEMTDAGYPIHQTSIGKIVNPGRGKRRAISVDDALGFAKVLGIPIDELLLPVAAALHTELREILTRFIELSQKREEIDREAAQLAVRLVHVTRREGGEEQFEQVVNGASGDDLRRTLDELHRWGKNAIDQLDAAVEGLSGEEALERMRRVILGERIEDRP